MRKIPKTFFKLSASLFLVFFIIELLEVYLWNDKNSIHNSHGFRDKEYSYKKPENIFRILVLGDSQTLGQGIKRLEDTWHKKLEVLMNGGFNHPKFEVISLSGGGWNTDTQLYELFKRGFKYNPNLIIIGFNHNDVPVPHASKCKNREIKFFPDLKVISWFRKNSKVYQLIEFRLNRLLETLEQKPGYADCINRRFESRGWHMEEVYLDTILMSAQIKNIPLMLTTLPLLHKLGDDYPLKKADLKIQKYCTDRAITYLDLFTEGFKGLNSTPLRVSITDRHLNEVGTEVVSQTLFKKLKALKTYKYLPKFSGAFDFKDLLDQKKIVVELDKKFSELINQNSNVVINFQDEQLKVIKHLRTLEYVNTLGNQIDQKIIKVNLDLDGNFRKSEIVTHKKNAPNLYFQNNKYQNGTHYLARGIKTQQGNILKKTEKLFLGNHISTGSTSKIKLFPNLEFMDPKSLEVAFSEEEKPKSQLSNLETFETISKFIKLNPNLFFDFRNKGYILKNKFDKLPRLEKILIYKEMEWTKYLFTLAKLGHSRYIDSLIKDILKYNPVPVLLRSIERYYFLNKKFKELDQLYQSNPTMPNRFQIHN